MHLQGKPVCSFDPEGLIFAAGINSEMVKLYDLRSFDKVRGAGSMHTSYVCKRRETGQQSTSVHRPFRSLY
jgi:hypothetical protein